MDNNNIIKTVQEIRTIMEKSSRFLSFSGSSTVFIGLFALAGAFFAHKILDVHTVTGYQQSEDGYRDILLPLAGISAAVFLLSLFTIFFFSWRKAKKMRIVFFNRITWRTLINFFVPLLTGGVFCIALLVNNHPGLISSVMLLFYGLSLINVSKFTYGNIFWLGCLEMVLGLLSAFFPANGLLFWAMGFGLLHILYGVYFYLRVEKVR
jgi:hypothetical protein